MRAVALTLIACAAFLTALASALPAVAQDDNLTATPERAATLTILRPRSAADIFLDVWIKAYTPPLSGAVDAVVKAGPVGGQPVEIGRISIFPSQPFNATEAREQRAYRFDATALLRRLEPNDAAIVVSVALIPMDEKFSPQGARIMLGKAEFSPRP
jgi:hypothetical protein